MYLACKKPSPTINCACWGHEQWVLGSAPHLFSHGEKRKNPLPRTDTATRSAQIYMYGNPVTKCVSLGRLKCENKSMTLWGHSDVAQTYIMIWVTHCTDRSKFPTSQKTKEGYGTGRFK